jgi:hypothetical protein
MADGRGRLELSPQCRHLSGPRVLDGSLGRSSARVSGGAGSATWTRIPPIFLGSTPMTVRAPTMGFTVGMPDALMRGGTCVTGETADGAVDEKNR